MRAITMQAIGVEVATNDNVCDTPQPFFHASAKPRPLVINTLRVALCALRVLFLELFALFFCKCHHLTLITMHNRLICVFKEFLT